MEKFKYYNRALLPNCLNNEEISFTKQELKKAFKKHKKALFFVYTTNFDCGHDTGWYYVINDNGEKSIVKSSNYHRKINKINRCLDILPIVFSDFKSEIDSLTLKCFGKYKGISKKEVRPFVFSNKDLILGCFKKENHKLIGYLHIIKNGKQITTSAEKTDSDEKSYFPSFALNYYVVTKMCDFSNGEFITNGARNIVHKTNHQDFLISQLGFRKAFCNIHIVYRNVLVHFSIIFCKILSPIFKLFDANPFFNRINGILLMDKIYRNQVHEKE